MDGEKTQVKISNEFKIQFLNKILSDTSHLKIITSKEQLISNHTLMPPFSPYPYPREISHIEYISKVLEIDTSFVRQQMVDNKQLDLKKLSTYGFNIFDLKAEIKNQTPFDQIWEKVDSINVGTDNYSLLEITKPIFNKEKNLVYIRLKQGSGGETLILEKVDGEWKKKKQLDSWVE